MSRSFLMVLPKRDAVGRRAGRERHLDLGDRGGVEAGAERGEQRQHLRRRVRLDGVEHPGVRQGLGEGLVVVADDVEIDDEARPFVAPLGVFRNSRMRAVMALLSPTAHGRHDGPGLMRFARCSRSCAMEDARPSVDTSSTRSSAALDWNGETPHRTAGKDGQASSVTRAGGGMPAETRKARSVVALSRVPCGEQGVPVSPPAAGQISWRAFAPQAAGRPLVRLPTDRHTATGTCEIGHGGNK